MSQSSLQDPAISTNDDMSKNETYEYNLPETETHRDDLSTNETHKEDSSKLETHDIDLSTDETHQNETSQNQTTKDNVPVSTNKNKPLQKPHRQGRLYSEDQTKDPLNQLLDWFSSDRSSSNAMMGWGDVKMDSKETSTEYLLYADIPGVSKSDIKVSVNSDRILTIEAERFSETTGEDDTKTHWTERTFGHVHRSLRLPKTANTDECHCKYDNGVLCIRIGKKSPSSDVDYLVIE